ncbi:MAG: family 16 glycoside hydrolase [Verrucomicrobiota bacterium]
MRRKFLACCLIGLSGSLTHAELFNGKDLEGWSASEMAYWSVKDGAIVGHSDQPIKKNEFLWHKTEVKDFYLSVDVKIDPPERNAGIQFRSKKSNAAGQAHGYQADVGKGVWGKLYHEHGRGALHWDNIPPDAVKHGAWNHYEILVVGDRIWTAINGRLCVAMQDPWGEKSGYLSLQIHSGPPQTVQYRIRKFDPAPKVELLGMDEDALNKTLKPPKDAEKQKAKKKAARIEPRGVTATTGTPVWPLLIAMADPGSKKDAWAQTDFDDSGWKTMKLPAHFEPHIQPDYDGVVWFRKTVELPPEAAGRPGRLGLGAIDDMDVTWVNGRRVGGLQTPGHHDTPRNYTIPAGLLKAGRNVIAVRVFDHGWPGGISGKPHQMALQVGETSVRLDVPWRFKAGANLVAVKSATPADVESPTTTSPSFENGFALNEGDVVVVMGGTGAFEQQRQGYLETLLTRVAGQKQVVFRNMAWQADTVYRQQRPRNFSPLSGQLKRVGATMIMLHFGQMESLDGSERLPDFIAAYEKLLDTCRAQTERLVLVTPRRFTRPANRPHLPDLTPGNGDVNAYAEAILALAQRRHLLAFDLSGFDAPTTDGLQLTSAGHWQAACLTMTHLFGDSLGPLGEIDDRGRFMDSDLEALRQAILHKNRLWHQFWRPTNWAFIYGNRQHVPSSRDHRNRNVRWFPAEINDIIPRIEDAETRIAQLMR